MIPKVVSEFEKTYWITIIKQDLLVRIRSVERRRITTTGYERKSIIDYRE